MAKRLSADFLNSILHAFNSGQMDAVTAAERLEIGRSRLYQLRFEWLKNQRQLTPACSGGPRSEPWPEEVMAFLREFLPHCAPLNFSLLADELARRFDFLRSRSAVADVCRLHFPLLVAPLLRGPKPRRRWQSARRTNRLPQPHPSLPHHRPDSRSGLGKRTRLLPPPDPVLLDFNIDFLGRNYPIAPTK